ncbi:MAG TPA: tRNA lysidine(34) synthetase TilS [Kofleriaceae bacterium]|nr:tRNA lysidine(34) synthetase TilS [Kofleriaceae bacterium]
MTTMGPVDLLTAAVHAQIGQVGPGLYGVACSGGGDSLALADAAIRVAGASHVVVVTIDHGLTAAAAAASAAVVDWARGQGAAAVVRRVRVARQASREAAARDARYAALTALADELGLACVMLGHTARDQAETVLLRILRGTGPAGLAAIPAVRGRFVRPLLALDRAVIDAYAAARGLPVWSDPMNADRRIARVRVREEILPALRRENPQLDAALVRLARAAGEWLAVIDDLARPYARFPIDAPGLAAQPAAVRKRALALALDALGRDFDARHLDELDRLVTQPARGRVAIDLPGGAIVRAYDRLAPADAAPPPPDPPHAAPPAFDPRAFELRAWRAGDRMRPARLKGRSRKLSDLYIDAKVPREHRLAARVLVRRCDAAIVWAEHVGASFDFHEGADPYV